MRIHRTFGLDSDLTFKVLERPALDGAGDYRQWLSGRDAVPAAGQPAADEPGPAD